jgi:hypothetical protein
MQGVDDLDKIFAMPLLGVEELSFWPVTEDVDPATVTWTIEQITEPQGTSAEIRDDTLYIWGSDPSWAGYGEVTLSATAAGGASGTVTIPVTVFKQDKTLINKEGMKDYFVPWSPELDINRILSVEEHMRKYNKGKGELDRTIQWAQWKKMVPRHDVDLADIWMNEYGSVAGWPQPTKFALVDVFLSDLKYLGVDAIRALNAYCIADAQSTDIYPDYDTKYFTLTKRPEEEAYVINEAHRLGMMVATGNIVNIQSENHWEELYAASPTPVENFFTNLAALNASSLDRWSHMGVDMVDLCPAVSSMNKYDNTYAQAVQLNDGIMQLAASARAVYAGPLLHSAHYGAKFFPGQSILQAPFWNSFDLIGMSGWAICLTDAVSPTLGQLVAGWRGLIDRYFQPFQRRYNKPFAMWENGSIAVTGCSRYGLICPRTEGYDPMRFDVSDMELYYRAHDIAFREMDGYFAPGWYSYPLHPYFRGGVRDTITATPRLKIEDTIQEICTGDAVPRIIQIDANSSDWLDTYVVGVDPSGDSRGNEDIVKLSYISDDDYLYFAVTYNAPLDSLGKVVMDIDTTGDGEADAVLLMSNDWSQIHDWASSLYSGADFSFPIVGFADAIDAGEMIELRIARRFLVDYLEVGCFRVRVAHFPMYSWTVEDTIDWVTLWESPETLLSTTAFQLLEWGVLREGSEPLTISGTRSVVGEYDGSGSYTPYLRTNPGRLPLTPRGRYRVCFDYRILDPGSEGFEVLFFSPAGASKNEWVKSLRTHGEAGEVGHACLDGQLLNYGDYEIRWNVVATGAIAIDNVLITNLESGVVVAEEDFESW